jgi:hypothetical protein
MYGCTVQYLLYERKYNAKRVAYGKNTFTPHYTIFLWFAGCRSNDGQILREVKYFVID